MFGDELTERMPAMPRIAVAKPAELDVATAMPISGTVDVTVPPAAATRATRPAGSELPFAMIRYCRAAAVGAGACGAVVGDGAAATVPAAAEPTASAPTTINERRIMGCSPRNSATSEP